MLSQTLALQAVDYNPRTGEFRNRKTGQPVATGNSYQKLWVGGRTYLAHRVAWLIETGIWPCDRVDHIDGDHTNNSFSNLRLASHAENMRNSRMHRNNKVGLKGVHRDKNKFRACITIDGKNYKLGSFNTPEEAHQVYLDAAKKAFGEFARAA